MSIDDDPFWPEQPTLYDVARQVCHEFGVSWTDPRTGITYPPPNARKTNDDRQARCDDRLTFDAGDHAPDRTTTTTYTCEDCGGTFEARRPDAEAQAEAVRNFGVRGDEPGMAIVCDDCYREIMGWIRN